MATPDPITGYNHGAMWLPINTPLAPVAPKINWHTGMSVSTDGTVTHYGINDGDTWFHDPHHKWNKDDEAKGYYSCRYDEHEAAHHYDPEGITKPEPAQGVLTLDMLDEAMAALKSYGKSDEMYRDLQRLMDDAFRDAKFYGKSNHGTPAPLKGYAHGKSKSNDDYSNGRFVLDTERSFQGLKPAYSITNLDEEPQPTYLRPEHKKGHYRKHSKNKWERT